ncbi:serine/threonine-protein kinase MARK2-like [Saccopteryx leptura]|uniref:serine/threonine-protein kinase MARK2-like n=1 Tax=Saccopteryx leptura TaxID=249018 RepID=UPI00339BC10B
MGILIAVKILSIRGCPTAFQEIELLKALNHSNVVKLVEVIVTDSTLFTIMEYVSGGDLFNYLPSNRPIPEAEVRCIFRQLILALQYCHRLGIVHRDQKLENILVDANKNIKVTDFGVGTKVKKDELKTYYGTECYMAPEMLQCRTYEGQKVDIWGLSVILFQMVTGELPFKDQHLTKVKKKIMTGKFTILGFLSVKSQALLKNLMTLNPSKRSAVHEILKDPWVNNGQKEHLKPYTDVPRGNLYSEIVEEMNLIGLHHHFRGGRLCQYPRRRSVQPRVLGQHSTIQPSLLGHHSTTWPSLPGHHPTTWPSLLGHHSTIWPSLLGQCSTSGPAFRANAPPSNPVSQASAPSSSHKTRASAPPSSQQAMNAACSPAFQPDPVHSPTTPSSNNTSCRSRTQE